jgi:hypothetical protein
VTEHNAHADDASLEALLRASSPAPPFDDVDWAALHARTTAGAAPLLRRRSATWWQLLGRRSSRGLRNIAAAAAVTALLATGSLMPERPSAVSYPAEFRTIEEELALSLSYASVPLLAADADNGDVIDALLLYDREEW